MASKAAINTLLVTSAVGNFVLLYIVFHPVLDQDSIAMMHMDPSEIIETAIPLSLLNRFTAQSIVTTIIMTWLCKRIKSSRDELNQQPFKIYNIMNHLVSICWATISMHCVFILCGINPWKLPLHTFVSSLYVTVNAVLPITLLVPSSGGVISKPMKYEEVMAYLFRPLSSNMKRSTQQMTQQKQYQEVHKVHQCCTLGTFIGMCACAIFRVLDHGLQIQRYPIPIIVGATVGRVGGVLLAMLMS